MLLRAAAPASDKIIVERTRGSGTQHRNDSSGPLLRDLGANLYRHTVNDARNDPLHGLLLEEIAAQFQSCRARRRDPQLHGFFLGRVFEAVKQTQLLKHSQGDRRKYAHVRNDGEEAAEAESRAFEGSHSGCRPDCARGDWVDHLRTQKEHVVPGFNRQAVCALDAPEVFPLVNLNLLVGAAESGARSGREDACER